MDKAKHLKHNLAKLESVTEADWIRALKKCRDHVSIRLRKRTVFGAHNEERLGMDPIDYYVSFAYDSILDGNWEWKDGRTLGQQMVRIAENRIGKEVEKFGIEQKDKFSLSGEDIDDFFYSEDPSPEEPSFLQEIIFNDKITQIETAVDGDENLEIFWECIKEGMKRDAIAIFMEKSPKQIDKFREKLINKIKNSPHFQLG